MPTLRCPKCGSDEFEEKMFPVYDMWGQFMDTRVIKVCKRCGTELPEKGKEEEPS